MTRAQIVACGYGGQGIVFLTRVIAQAALVEGLDVLTSETHGMAQRGGIVDSHVKIGDFRGSLVRTGRADAVLVLDRGRAADARSLARPHAPVVVNAPDACDATGIAQRLGAARAVNLVLLGHAIAAAPDHFPGAESIRAALELLSRPDALVANRCALQKGIESA